MKTAAQNTVFFSKNGFWKILGRALGEAERADSPLSADPQLDQDSSKSAQSCAASSSTYLARGKTKLSTTSSSSMASSGAAYPSKKRFPAFVQSTKASTTMTLHLAMRPSQETVTTTVAVQMWCFVADTTPETTGTRSEASLATNCIS